MKRILPFLTLFLICAAANAQGYLDVGNYNNTYEINIIPGPPPAPEDGQTERDMNKCQAVRLNKDWFITAAHCLQNACNPNSGCTLQARLLVGPGWEMLVQTYAASPDDNATKIYNPQSAQKNNIAYDIALIKFARDKSKYIYLTGNYNVTKEMFLETARPGMLDMANAINGVNFPVLLALKTQTPKILNRALAVPSIWGGQRQVLASRGPVYYSPQNQYIFTDNFGIRGGISGSGVFTSGGELVGVTSTTGQLRAMAAGRDEQFSYTFLTVFNDDVISFINRNAGAVRSKDSNMDYFKVIPEEQRDFVFGVEKSVI